jgi:hypothetical protein
MTGSGQRHDPSSEAHARLNDRYEVRVLEPSPPAVTEPPFFADDPVARGEVPSGWQVVSPIATGDVLWNDLAAGDPSLAEWCANRWLGAYRRLMPAPPALIETRTELHRVAEQVIKPEREKVNGKIGLRYTRNGFGTPFFGDGRQLRVDGTELVTVEHAVEVGRSPLTVDPGAAAFIGDWYGFAASVLEELRAGAPADEAAATRAQLWPEHFDMSVELGPDGARATYGLSPGDDDHPEPYVYVSTWQDPPPGELWNATAFPGAELPFRALLDAVNQRDMALAFLRARHAALTATGS